MHPPSQCLTPDEFTALVARFAFSRRITCVHVHHTWRPRASDFRGEPTIEAMRTFHMKTMGWSDIAQHVTIDPQGRIWTGRDWNQPPASARGFNGNASAGPFMFEMIGDFDRGQERPSPAQLGSAALVTAAVQRRFRLPADEFRFHNEMSTKSCPGSAFSRDAFRQDVERARTKLEEDSSRAQGNWANRDAERVSRSVEELLARMRASNGAATRAPQDGDAEPAEEEMPAEHLAALQGANGTLRTIEPAVRGGSDRTETLTPAILDELAPHLINLRQGRFSSGGRIQTERSDVDALIDGLDRWVTAHGETSPVVLFAHGGLVSEDSGLAIAQKHVSWWKRNGVYPIYFIWETGFCETLGQLLSAAAGQALPSARALDLKDLTDPLVERAARALRGPAIWGSMQRSAERAFDEPGRESNGRYLLGRLAELCGRHRDRVALHAVGHSAGSIFHTHLLQAWRQIPGAQGFKTLQLLAPAVSSELFAELEPLIGPERAVEHATMFTMRKHEELADTCMGLYGKSLLYLIHYALEDERETDILGLEVSLRRSPALKALFGLSGPSARGEVIFSPTPPASHRSRSASTAGQHGAFDDDAPTMTSVLCRVLADPDQVKVPYAAATGISRGAVGDCLRDLSRWRNAAAFAQAPLEPVPPARITAHSPDAGSPVVDTPGPGGRRRALCVGINTYPTMPLNGCVRDAESWAAVLRDVLRFEPPTMLVDDQATRARILESLDRLVGQSRSGDVLVFQFAGHGTRAPDYDGDEAEGLDEALCPYDTADGALLIDDDVRQVFERLPRGVSLTCFIDCCHSGTITRFAVGGPGSLREGGQGRQARFIRLSEAELEAHRQFRISGTAGAGRGESSGQPGSRDAMRHVVFAACRDEEVAYEENGQGEFTVRAVGLLRRNLGQTTNTQFAQAVTEAFGTDPRQHAVLDCADAARNGQLLGTVLDAPPARSRGGEGWVSTWQRGQPVAHRAGRER